MTQQQSPFRITLVSIVALALGSTISGARAQDDDDETEIPFDEAILFFELNNTDGDLGIHSLIDGEPWKRLEIQDPSERTMLDIRLRGRLRRQGLTELFYESAEPTFDELAPETFFRRFPEGEYEVSGVTLEGDELESIVEITHLMPAPPTIFVNGEALPDGCDEDPLPTRSDPFLVSWPAITHSHPELGRTNEPIDVVSYELVLEREEPTALKYSIIVAPGVTSVQLPAGLASSGEELKAEVLVREDSGNQTATESCFEVD